MAKTPTKKTEIENLFDQGRLMHFNKGQTINRADDDAPHGAYLIRQGYVKAYSITDEGDENVHLLYNTDEIFPLVWLLRDTNRNLFYDAFSDVVVSRISQRHLKLEILRQPTIARALIQRLAEQLHVYEERLDNLQYAHARQRIAYRLLFLASRFGLDQDDGILIQPCITQQFLANTLSLSRETVSREINSMKREALITRMNGCLVLKDIPKLQAILGDVGSDDLWGLKSRSVGELKMV